MKFKFHKLVKKSWPKIFAVVKEPDFGNSEMFDPISILSKIRQTLNHPNVQLDSKKILNQTSYEDNPL